MPLGMRYQQHSAWNSDYGLRLNHNANYLK